MKRNVPALVLIALVVLLLAPTGIVSAESPQPFTNFSRFFSLPPSLKDNWAFGQLPTDPGSGCSGFFYSRKVIVDPAGVKISPKAAFIFEPLPPLPANLDAKTISDYVVAYSVKVRARLTIPTTIDKVYGPGDKLFPWKKAIGYKARYNDGSREHTLLLVHGLFENSGRTYGVQVIMDSTTSVFPELEPEFTAMLAQIGGGQ